jgi:hypothetical protein
MDLLKTLFIAFVSAACAGLIGFLVTVKVVATYWTLRYGDWQSAGAGFALALISLHAAALCVIGAFLFVILSHKHENSVLSS